MKYAKLSEQGVPFHVYARKDAKNVFYYRFELLGKPTNKSAKTFVESEAEEIARQAIRLALLQTRTPGSTSLYLPLVVANYHATTKMALRPSTGVARARLFKWLSEGFPTLQINEISIPQFHSFLSTLQDTLKPQPSYWRDILSRYNGFWEWCILTKKCLLNPMTGYPRPKVKDYAVDDEVWEDWEFQRVYQALKPEDALLIKVLRYTGIYPMDYAFLEKSHFVQRDCLTLIKQRAKNTEIYRQPLDGRIEEDLKQKWLPLRSPSQRLFTNVTDKNYRSWYGMLQKRVAETWRMVIRESPPKMLKSLRHTFLTEAIERGVPEDVLLQWAGHNPGSTVLRRHYLHRKSTARYRYVETPNPLGLTGLQLNGTGKP